MSTRFASTGATQTAFIFSASSSRCAILFYRLLFEMLYSVTRYENLAFTKECLEDIFPKINLVEIGGRLLVQKQKVKSQHRRNSMARRIITVMVIGLR
jgi:hypothetical protein